MTVKPAMLYAYARLDMSNLKNYWIYFSQLGFSKPEGHTDTKG